VPLRNSCCSCISAEN